MWELFSLGKVPYPGLTVDRLIRELLNGYRMEKPEFASNEIGHLMAECWKAEPKDRPTFNQLEAQLSNHLDEPLLARRCTNADKPLHNQKEGRRTTLFAEMKLKFIKNGRN